MKKNGNAVIDGAAILVILFFIVYAVIIMKYDVADPINDAIQGNDDLSAQAKTVSQDSTDIWLNWDTLFLMILISLWVAAIISAHFIESYPVFFVFSIIGMIIVLIVTFNLADTYTDTITNTEYATFGTDFPYMHFVMDNLVYTIMFMMLTIGVSLYGKG